MRDIEQVITEEKKKPPRILEKIPDEDVFTKNFLRLYKTLDKEKILGDVKRLKEMYPEKTPEDLSEVCINNYAKKDSFWGGISAMPGCLPGLGTIAQVGSAVADSLALIRSHAILILGIGTIYDMDPRDDERMIEILMILSNNMNLNKSDEAKLRQEVLKGGGARILKNIAAGMSRCFCRRSIFRFLPVAGIAVGAGMNYYATKDTGKKACEFYRRNRNRKRRGWNE